MWRDIPVGMPIPTTETVFEVVAGGRIHQVAGARLKKWIENADYVEEIGGHKIYEVSDCSGGWMRSSPGTHVSLSHMGHVEISNIRIKEGRLRVSYRVIG